MYVCVRHGSMCAPPCRLVLMPLILISSAGVFLCFPMPMSKPRINTAANRLGDCLSRCLFLSHPLLLEVWMAAQWFVVCKWLDCLIGRCVSAGSDGVVLSFFSFNFPPSSSPKRLRSFQVRGARSNRFRRGWTSQVMVVTWCAMPFFSGLACEGFVVGFVDLGC